MDNQMQGLSLFDEEGKGSCLEQGDDLSQVPVINCALCVGCFLTDRHIRFPVMKNRMASLWRPGRGVAIKELSPHLSLFQFFHEIDLKRVLDGCPWTFDNHLLILHKLGPGEIPSQISLFHVHFWVQVVSVDVCKPLKCKKKIVLSDGDIKRELGSWLRAQGKRLSSSGGDRWLREDGDFGDGGGEAKRVSIADGISQQSNYGGNAERMALPLIEDRGDGKRKRKQSLAVSSGNVNINEQAFV
ncbi:hypothetical protein PTKIN_Ptkin09bG0195000 [Pterospermum kingtungense]